MIRKLATAAVVALMALPVWGQEDSKAPTTRLSRDSILIGDQVEWIIDLHLGEGEEYFVEKPDAEPTPGVETIKELSFDTLSTRKGKLDVQGRIILTCFDSGSFFLPPVMAAVQHTDGSVDTIFYDSPALEVNTIPIDTATFEPYDIKGQIKYPLTFKEILPWVGGALILAALIFLLVRWIKLRKENRTFFGKPVVQDPPHIVALRSLEKTRGQKLCQNGKQKQFYTQVTDALRQYIAARYEISALEQTSAEIFKDLEDKAIDPSLFEKVKDLFTTADFVKFAKHQASEEENEEAIPTAIRFVNETYMQQVEQEKKEES